MWVIRTYKCGRVIEKSKFWAPAGTRVRGGRVKGNTSAAKHDQNARQAVRMVARILNCNFCHGDLYVTAKFDDDHLAEIGYRGVVLETFGAGGMHFHRRDLLEKLRMLEKKGIVVVACSQCLYEPSNFTIYEVGRKLLETGVIPAGDMTTEAAVTKLMWALGQTDDPEKVKEIFSRNYTGEISE